MSFCKYSSSYIIADKTVVDNIFINDFLPFAPNICVKVYLMGLSKCSNATAQDNNLENFANVLQVSTEDIMSAFMYWQDQGLVQVLSTDPVEVRFLPPTSNLGNVKKYKVNKYTDFNLQMQEILSQRMLTPTEYAEYYNVIENYHLEPEALIMIAKYCVDLKGENIRYPYITTIAKNWSQEGLRTTQDIENKIKELGVLDDKVTLVLNAINTKRKIQLEDVQMLNRWLQEFDYDLNTIIYTAKRMSLKKRIDMLALNNQLLKYYEMKLTSIAEIENYEESKQTMFSVAKSVVKNLGLYYEDLTKVVETYVVKWQQLGYTQDTLTEIADYSFRNAIRTLEGYDAIVQKLYRLGITTKDSLHYYLADLIATDKKIGTILEMLGVKRNVNAFDRSCYNTWTTKWNFNDDIINYATELSIGKNNAVQYMNKILSNWKSQNIDTLEKAKAKSDMISSQPSSVNANNSQLSKEEINALFSNLEIVDV